MSYCSHLQPVGVDTTCIDYSFGTLAYTDYHTGHAGACLQPPDNCWLLCEYLSGGTLSHWLHGDRQQGGR